MGKLKDLTGQRFGRLTAVGLAYIKNKKSYWYCRCDCGVKTIVRSDMLKNAHTRSCGCLHKEGNFTKHSMCYTKIYRIWSAMIQRCTNPNNSAYKNYGGRGITICPEWIEDFQAFYDYVSQLPRFGEENFTLDRIDNNGNYEPNNVRWTDYKAQARNKRSNRLVEYQGVQMSLIDASKLSGINYNTLNKRVRSGNTGDKLFRPVRIK